MMVAASSAGLGCVTALSRMPPASRRVASPRLATTLRLAAVLRLAMTLRLATALLLATTLLPAATAAPAQAQEPVAADTIDGARRLAPAIGGYVRGITVLHDRGWDLPSLPGLVVPARETGSHGQVGRLKWLVEGDGWRLDVHQRVQVRVTSEPAGTAAVGFGVGAVPDRLVDLRLDLVDRDRVQAWHDVDRLAVIAHTRGVDVTLGRQAITWGISALFPVADLWAAFSPFEQDTEEKPGIDAARALFYPRAGLEMDVVVAHRGSLDDVSAGVRGTLSRPGADIWAGGGRFWRQFMAMGGITVLLDQGRLRAEGVLPWTAEDDVASGTTRGFQRPRVTLGAERLGGTWLVGAEYHYNGIGRADAVRYLEAASDPRLQRGESYFLGRHYAGALGTWSPDVQNRLNLGLTALVNLGDPSAAFTPSATYDLGQATRLSAGALLSAGRAPAFTLAPPFLQPRSEFGLYGHALFTTISVFF
jgi:hypothetical protein